MVFETYGARTSVNGAEEDGCDSIRDWSVKLSYLIGILIGLALWASCMLMGPADPGLIEGVGIVALPCAGILIVVDVAILTRPALAEPGPEAARELWELDDRWEERIWLRSCARGFAATSLGLSVLSAAAWVLARFAEHLAFPIFFWYAFLIFVVVFIGAVLTAVWSVRRVGKLKGLGDPREGAWA